MDRYSPNFNLPKKGNICKNCELLMFSSKMCFFLSCAEALQNIFQKTAYKLFTKIFFIADTLKIRFLQCAVAGSALDWYYSYYVYSTAEHVLRCNNNIKCNGLEKHVILGLISVYNRVRNIQIF